MIPTLTEGSIPRNAVQIPPGISGDIMAQAQFLGVSPEDFLSGIGLMKASTNDKNKVMPGVGGRPDVLRGFQEPIFDYHAVRGVREQIRPIGYSILREIESKNPVVSAIVNTRCRQMRPFVQKSEDAAEPGFRIVLRDNSQKPTKAEKVEMSKLADWFYFTGRTDFEGWEDREDNLLDVMVKMARDYLVIDQIAIEIRRDRGGEIVDFWAMDGATILRTVQTGYRGNKQDFDPRAYAVMDSAMEKTIVEQKLALIPDVDKIRFVQKLNGRFVAAYTRKDMLFDSLNKRTDIRFYGYGFPPLEQAMNACSAFLFGMAYNAEAFNSGTLPKIALAFKDANFSTEQLMALQDEFIANFRGIHGAWRIPMLNQDVNVIDLLKSPRDMEYMKYLEFMGSLICAVMGIDAQEMGLRWQQAQNVLSENQGARMSFSKDRGLNDLLGAMAEVWNKMLMALGLADKYKFEYTGIEPEDSKSKAELIETTVKTKKTLNEVRAEEDLPPDKYGDIVLDPVYLQYRQGQEQAAAGEGGEMGGEAPDGAENGFEDAADEAVDEMFKANTVNTARTLLL